MPLKPESSAPASDSRRLIFLAFDAMSQNFLDELVEANLVPHIAALLDRGSWGRATFPLPRHAESGWVSVATGMLPDRHGVLHANERIGDSAFVRAVSADALKTPGLWHFAAATGMRPAVIGWPATGGLALDNCLVVAPGIAVANGRINQAWPLHPGAVSPPAMREAVREHRMHPEEIRPEDVCAMLGSLSSATREQLRPEFAAALAELVTLHALGTYALTELHSDALMLRFPFLATVGRLLSRAPSDPGIRSCLVHCYQFLDLLIGRYQNLAGRGAIYAVISNGNSGIVTKPESTRRNDEGLLILSGPGIREDAVIGSLAATDIVPTIAALFAWRLEVQLDGEPLFEAMNLDAHAAATPGGLRRPEPMKAEDIKRTAAVVLENAALLKREEIPIPEYSAQTQFARQLECETLFSLAEVRFQRGENLSAIAVLRELLQRFPESIPARAMLAEVLFWSGKIEDCAKLAGEFSLVQAGGMWADLAYGAIAYAHKDWSESTARFESLAAAVGSPVNAYAWLGWICAHQAQWERSRAHFKAAADREPHNARAWEGLGIACTMLHRHSEAAHAFGHAVSLMPRSAQMLLRLSQAWEKCGESGRAAQFRARALRIDPGMVAADMQRSVAPAYEHGSSAPSHLSQRIPK